MAPDNRLWCCNCSKYVAATNHRCRKYQSARTTPSQPVRLPVHDDPALDAIDDALGISDNGSEMPVLYLPELFTAMSQVRTTAPIPAHLVPGYYVGVEYVEPVRVKQARAQRKVSSYVRKGRVSSVDVISNVIDEMVG